MIDAATVAKIFGSLGVCWALGYGVGNAVFWVRRLVDAA